MSKRYYLNLSYIKKDIYQIYSDGQTDIIISKKKSIIIFISAIYLSATFMINIRNDDK